MVRKKYGMAGLVDVLAVAFAKQEGFYLKREEAKRRKIAWPTVAQRNRNPLNVRRWRRGGKLYPTTGGYVDFMAWAELGEPGDRQAMAEGWRVGKALIQQYVEGRYHGGRSPTLLEMLQVWAPSADGNDPRRYAVAVSSSTGIPPDVPLSEFV